ncbi:muramoyltetrapeptide carboxypeptidase [Promicromonospora umidemergens]|uniref:LD-carboxypeptidase n=1 Tax=Promicromonospora umidemergens TaxID=629679 RepID=A0ABP8WVG8_9MICO|nr:LD-carboxypeptidase [Promicromonospora umidemergens]MCP2283674.1 muramoyltetrapeptide carboxypeptidase [Promicromonospora umidemergens]
MSRLPQSRSKVQKLEPDDVVALVSPASWSDESWLAESIATIESWGFRARVGRHATDRLGYLAGGDRERAADLNAAIRDPEVRAILCLRGGCGSLRLLADVDTDALRADPKPLIGFSDITALHQVWRRAGVPSVHGAVAGTRMDTVRQLLVGERGEPVRSDRGQFGADLTTTGTAFGPLYGGNLDMLARSVGVVDNDLEGHVLLLETHREVGLGMVDRALTQLLLSGALARVLGVAVGTLEGFEEYQDREWTVLDVLRDRLGSLGVPVLAGLPLGHLENPVSVPLGVECELDADAGALAVAPLTA